MNEWLERNRGHVLTTLINLIAVGAAFFLAHRPRSPAIEIVPAPSPTLAPTPTPAPTTTPARVTVYVSGAVRQPDVYSLPEGSRVKQAVGAAGGFTDEADEARVNLASSLFDGQQIYVPTAGEETVPIATPPPNTPVSDESSPDAVVNINTASLDELDTLPGIGPAIAQRIIDYRTNNGPFESIEEIKDVRGIGDATFADMRDRITTR